MPNSGSSALHGVNLNFKKSNTTSGEKCHMLLDQCWADQCTEKIDFYSSGNICLSKWSQIFRQYLANNAFASVPNMNFIPLS